MLMYYVYTALFRPFPPCPRGLIEFIEVSLRLINTSPFALSMSKGYGLEYACGQMTAVYCHGVLSWCQLEARKVERYG